ncbi:putative UV endonuclease [Cystobacter fuscus DSM 2262]|uniref:UV endonuclease n=1 Tax=Cystobacter fuscus (strain ATCC 25194 / DSM 2262 / NBRC 100088 / M29) TaxID=1242864 RepID=S9PNU5_CYSF2|nr:putative UV endonuclease [Cystobacter fuscus DSM 2262]
MARSQAEREAVGHIAETVGRESFLHPSRIRPEGRLAQAR